ncbi:MAG: hypothetical protein HY238_16885 [Acidobacteria bacterium]|nr:hypothetical protein [Acidobacteriota bacterium]
MLGIADADSAEHGSGSEHLFVTPVACPMPNRPDGAPKLFGNGKVRLKRGSRLFRIYGREETEEGYFCNYELNPRYEAQLQAAGLPIVARGENGEARAVELAGKRFFIATQFQPPLNSTAENPHPLILAFLEATRF